MGKSFWSKLVANGEQNVVSHKRVVSIISLTMLVILAIMSALGMSATTDYIYVFGVLTGGESMLTVIEKVKTSVNSIETLMSNSNTNNENNE